MDRQGQHIPFVTRLSAAILKMDAAKAAQATDAEGGGGAGQAPGPAAAPEAPGTGGSKLSGKVSSNHSSRKSSKDSSRKSHESEAVSSMAAALLHGSVPSAATRPLAREGVSLEVLKRVTVT